MTQPYFNYVPLNIDSLILLNLVVMNSSEQDECVRPSPTGKRIGTFSSW